MSTLQQLRQSYQDNEISFEEYDNTLKILAEEIYKEREDTALVKRTKRAEEVCAVIAAAVPSNVPDLAAAIPSWLVSADFNRGCITLTNRLIYFPALFKYRGREHGSIVLEGNYEDFQSPSVVFIFDDHEIHIEIYKGNKNDLDYLMKTLKRLQSKLNLKLDLSNIQEESVALLCKLDKLQQLIATFGLE